MMAAKSTLSTARPTSASAFWESFGAHQFYAKRPILGVLYLATCWSGFSIAMTLVDAIIAVPMKPDENGLILL